MSIKFKPKDREFAVIPDDVVELIVKIREQKIDRVRREITIIEVALLNKTMKSYRRSGEEKRLKFKRVELKGLLRAGGGDINNPRRGGMEYVLMRMKRLPYDRFYCKTSGGREWIIGLTHDVITKMSRARRKYNHGKYFVAVSVEELGKSNITATNSFHLIPQRRPDTLARHMHHHISPDVANQSKSPLDWIPTNTCLGGFGGPVRQGFATADVPELFRILHMFAERLNPDSALRRLRYLPHIQQVAYD